MNSRTRPPNSSHAPHRDPGGPNHGSEVRNVSRWIVEERFQTSRGRCLQAVIATTALNGGTADTGLTGTAGRIADLQASHPWRPAAKTATPRRLDTGLVHRTGRPRGPGRSGAPVRRSGPPGAPRQCHPRPPQPRYPWRRLPRVLRVPPPTWRRWQADPGLSSAECRQIRPVADAFVLVTGLQGCLEPWKL